MVPPAAIRLDGCQPLILLRGVNLGKAIRSDDLPALARGTVEPRRPEIRIGQVRRAPTDQARAEVSARRSTGIDRQVRVATVPQEIDPPVAGHPAGAIKVTGHHLIGNGRRAAPQPTDPRAVERTPIGSGRVEAHDRPPLNEGATKTTGPVSIEANAPRGLTHHDFPTAVIATAALPIADRGAREVTVLVTTADRGPLVHATRVIRALDLATVEAALQNQADLVRAATKENDLVSNEGIVRPPLAATVTKELVRPDG